MTNKKAAPKKVKGTKPPKVKPLSDSDSGNPGNNPPPPPGGGKKP